MTSRKSMNSTSASVVVWGGGTGGVAAAVQAARMGIETLLITPGEWLGGMVSAAGVAAPDGHELTCWQTGLWGNFLRGMVAHENEGLDQNWVSCFGFNPTKAEMLLQSWVNILPKLVWWKAATLKQVNRQGDRITGIQVEHGKETKFVTLEFLIDGSDLGETFPLANISFRWGWEPRELWSEPSAPSQLDIDHQFFFSDQPIQSPTWVVMGKLDRQQRIPIGDRNPREPFSTSTRKFGVERTITYGHLPSDLVMLNWPLGGNDWHQGLDRAISCSPKDRTELANDMKAHSLKFLSALEEASEGWLKPGEIFPNDSPSLAMMPYWREGRRLKGLDIVIETDLLPLVAGQSRGPLPLDPQGRCSSIAVGTYANDHHYPGDDWPLAPKSCRWGGRWTGTPFCIPFQALICSEVVNLLVADKAFSVSHMANGSTRLQPMIFNIGQAAGVAAALCIKYHEIPNELPVELIQKELIDDPIAPSAIFPIFDWPYWHPNWKIAQKAVLENPDCLNKHGEIDQTINQSNIIMPSHIDDSPYDSKAKLYKGILKIESNESYYISTSCESWPLITLEPGIRRWFLQCKDNQVISFLGVPNPWGPWLRVIKIII